MPSCLPSPRRRSSRWVNINVHNTGNRVHIHFVLRCSQRQSHNMDPSYVSILVTGQMPFSQHQRWSEPLCFCEPSSLTVPSPPPQAFEKVLSSNSHITKGHDYRPLLPWLGTGLLTSTGAKWHTRWSSVLVLVLVKILVLVLPSSLALCHCLGYSTRLRHIFQSTINGQLTAVYAKNLNPQEEDVDSSVPLQDPRNLPRRDERTVLDPHGPSFVTSCKRERVWRLPNCKQIRSLIHNCWEIDQLCERNI